MARSTKRPGEGPEGEVRQASRPPRGPGSKPYNTTGAQRSVALSHDPLIPRACGGLQVPFRNGFSRSRTLRVLFRNRQYRSITVQVPVRNRHYRSRTARVPFRNRQYRFRTVRVPFRNRQYRFGKGVYPRRHRPWARPTPTPTPHTHARVHPQTHTHANSRTRTHVPHLTSPFLHDSKRTQNAPPNAGREADFAEADFISRS